MAPAVSILLPVYNAATTLEMALDSLAAQSWGDFEVVAVDDGSTDGSLELLRQRAADDGRIRVVAKAHGGIVPALEAALASARGQLLARMDADDHALPARLARQVEWLERDPGLGLVSSLVAHPAPDAAATEGYARYVAWLNGVVSEAEIAVNRFVESPLAHPSVMFRREVVMRHGGYRDGDFPEDYELWLRWLEAGVRMAKVPEVLLAWNDPPGRLSRTHPRYAVEAFYRLKARYLARWLERYNPRHPAAWIWGSGKTSRQRAAWLEREGVQVLGYIDVDPDRRISGDRPIVHYTEVRSPAFGFIVSYVGKRDARDFIRAHLAAQGFVDGCDFLMAA